MGTGESRIQTLYKIIRSTPHKMLQIHKVKSTRSVRRKCRLMALIQSGPWITGQYNHKFATDEYCRRHDKSMSAPTFRSLCKQYNLPFSSSWQRYMRIPAPTSNRDT
ncbi:hypothetical protein M758_8G137500 [Ceratodon purpureus]|nr:hypothetical protein M758_8G137500 [Ceratodon purpureus]